MKKQRNNSYAIWVDHKTAVIACVDSEGRFTTETIKSGIVSRERYKGEGTSKTGMLGATISHQKKQQNKEHEMNRHFMKDVLAKISRPSIIIILGPADAKYDLHRELDKVKSLKPEFIEMKTKAKMTSAGIKAELVQRLRKGVPVK